MGNHGITSCLLYPVLLPPAPTNGPLPDQLVAKSIVMKSSFALFGNSLLGLSLDFTHLLLALSLEESKGIFGSIAGTNPKPILKASSLHLCGS